MKPVLKVILLALFLIVTPAALYYWDVISHLSNLSTLVRWRIWVTEHVVLASLLYLVVLSLASALVALPGALFALTAGLLFDPWLGSLLCLVGATFGASLSFLAGRYVLKDWVKPRAMKHKLLHRLLFEDQGRHCVMLLLVTRMVPLFPFNLQNFAYGITDLPLWQYSLCSFFFMAPGVVVFTFAAAGMIAQEHRSLYLWLAGAMTVLVTLVVLKSHSLWSSRPRTPAEKGF